VRRHLLPLHRILPRGQRKAGGRWTRIRAIKVASPRESSNSGGEGKLSTLGTTGSATATYLPGATGRKRRPSRARRNRGGKYWSGAPTIRRRPAFLPVARRGFCCAAGPARRRCDTRPVCHVLVRRQRGLYIHPNIWHGAIVPLADHAELRDRQGRVHARVSVDFTKEFGCYLAVPLRSPDA